MTEERRYPIPESLVGHAHLDAAHRDDLYRRSVEDPEGFWAEQAQALEWDRSFDRVLDWDFRSAKVRWFDGGQLNASVNCLDRHLGALGDQPAIIWEGDEPDQQRTLSYTELHAEVCRFGNALRGLGIGKGDRVCIYMPMVPEAAVAMLACTRIGAVHSVVFGGFSPTAVRDRILDADCRAVITADEGVRGGKRIPLKANVDAALAGCPGVSHNIVLRRTGGDVSWSDSRDHWYHELIEGQSDLCMPEPMEAEDPLFILYTSGSTGQPKGVLHTTAGYLLYASLTHRFVFDYHDGDIYWCTADVGWVTGHSYIVYGPLANGATTLMFEGVPNYPDVDRFWQVVDKHQVNIFYTAPTALRALMAHGDEPVERTSRQSLRILGTVGEPINPEAWRWYNDVVGDGRCAVVDTWWQTETGGIMISPLPGATEAKPGSATLPFLGVQPVLLDDEGVEIDGAGRGNLAIRYPWPGMMRSVHGDHQRMIDTYFARFPGYYFTGDGARRDEDGYFWITGRVDDVLNVSGHRLGTAEVESALVLHEAVAEAAVVGCPHPIKGQGIYAYVTLSDGFEASDELRSALVAQIRKEIGPFASPDAIQWAPGLPKTRSGKIMRRILRKVAAAEVDDFGDTSTLADPGVVDELVSNRQTVPS
jgi:acetyl-CoA synthetase